MRRVICLRICLVLVMLTAMTIPSAFAEDTVLEDHRATVTARLLNGRMTPSKGAMKTAFFDRGDILELTGRWSDDSCWVEVYAGEAGACWVARQYVNERPESFWVVNRDYNKIKIRRKPSEKGRVSGYLRKGREVEITQVLLGWGKCKQGWIDLYYVEEED